MIIKINIPVPSKLQLLIARLFGKKYHGCCLDSRVEGYEYKGKLYITKTWKEVQGYIDSYNLIRDVDKLQKRDK